MRNDPGKHAVARGDITARTVVDHRQHHFITKHHAVDQCGRSDFGIRWVDGRRDDQVLMVVEQSGAVRHIADGRSGDHPIDIVRRSRRRGQKIADARRIAGVGRRHDAVGDIRILRRVAVWLAPDRGDDVTRGRDQRDQLTVGAELEVRMQLALRQAAVLIGDVCPWQPAEARTGSVRVVGGHCHVTRLDR